MANGNHALKLVDAPSVSVCAPAAKADVDPSEIEKKIGAAVAAAVGVLAMAVCDFADRGIMSLSTRTWCGATLGHIAELRLDLLDNPLVDFNAIAHRAGSRAFKGHPSIVFLARLGPSEQVDEVIDGLISDVLAVSAKVAADELALRRN